MLKIEIMSNAAARCCCTTRRGACEARCWPRFLRASRLNRNQVSPPEMNRGLARDRRRQRKGETFIGPWPPAKGIRVQKEKYLADALSDGWRVVQHVFKHGQMIRKHSTSYAEIGERCFAQVAGQLVERKRPRSRRAEQHGVKSVG